MVRFVTRIVAIGLSILVLHGCTGAKSIWMYPHANSEAFGETSDEHRQQVVGVLEQDRRGLTEDLDLWFQTDRPTRLTRWNGR